MKGFYVWLVVLLSANVNGMSFRRSETSRGFALEDEELLGLELGSLVQSGRKFLRKVREWEGSHPAESVLAKCVVHYWTEVKIPGIVAATNEDDYEVGRRGLSTPVWIERHTPEDEPQPFANFQDVSNRIFDNGDAVGEVIRTQPTSRSLNHDGKFEFKRTALKALYLLYMELRELLTEYKLVGCSVHYLVAKFWEWVDNAP